jgi:plasmid stabilization system protein ParE
VAQRYRLQYLPLFWDDLEEAVFYIRDVLKNPAAADRLLDRVEEAILEHAKAPTMAQVYKTTRSRPQPYYWFAVGNYMVFYVVFDDVM